MKHKPKKSRLFIIFIVVWFLFAGVCFWYYYPHLYWKYLVWRNNGLSKIEKVPHSQMPEVEIHEDWVRHALDSLDHTWLRLPPDMDYEKSIVNGRIATARFHDKDISVYARPLGLFILNDDLQRASQKHPTQKTFLTFPQLYIEALGVGANDFHWSMSRREAVWHLFIIKHGRTTIFYNDPISAESFSGKNWEGLLFFPIEQILGSGRLVDSRHKCHFQWQCICCLRGGIISFNAVGEGTELDLDVVRGIVQSIEVSDDCLPLFPDSLWHQGKSVGKEEEMSTLWMRLPSKVCPTAGSELLLPTDFAIEPIKKDMPRLQLVYCLCINVSAFMFVMGTSVIIGHAFFPNNPYKFSAGLQYVFNVVLFFSAMFFVLAFLKNFYLYYVSAFAWFFFWVIISTMTFLPASYYDRIDCLRSLNDVENGRVEPETGKN